MRTLVRIVCVAALLATPSLAKDHDLPFKPVTGAFFALSVPNMTESVQWYSDKLGLAVVFQAQSGGIDVTTLEGGGLLVELIHDPSAQPRSGRPDLMHGPYKAGFMVKDFDATLANLRARGAEIAFGPFPAQNGQRANVIVRDNAGNLIQIFGD